MKIYSKAQTETEQYSVVEEQDGLDCIVVAEKMSEENAQLLLELLTNKEAKRIQDTLDHSCKYVGYSVVDEIVCDCAFDPCSNKNCVAYENKLFQIENDWMTPEDRKHYEEAKKLGMDCK